MPYEINRTELVWPGKYDEDGRAPDVGRLKMPFQVIERVNESRATREVKKEKGMTLFELWQGDQAETFEDGWRNKLIWGDNKLVMASLLEQFAGKIDLIYIDPPFATGADFSFVAEVGEEDFEVVKEQSLIEEKAYRDTWGRGSASYLSMMFERLVLMRDLLSDGGSLFLHCDWHVGQHLRLLLDEVFGADAFLNEIVWHYRKWATRSRNFQRNHDSIYWYAKNPTSPERIFEIVEFQDASEGTQRRWKGKKQRAVFDETGRRLATAEDGESTGAPLSDVWYISIINPAAQERVGYPTQKPEQLIGRIVEHCTQEGQLVADFFGGSGTTLAVAEKLGRRWIGADLGRFAIHTSRKRLLDIPGCKPFEVLNLGKYERKYWQVATFGEDLDEDGVISLYEYLVFVLKLYGASPVAGMQHLHGKHGSAFVHVGAVDAPVTMDEIADAIDECLELQGSELHVLGWEWEMGLHETVTQAAASRGVKLVLRQIPREVMEQQAAEKGDVAFFELAYLEVDVRLSDCDVVVELKDFVIPNTELVPEDIREKITKWSDYVDYWAVDWSFNNDTFMQGWVTYRTRRNRTLELTSDLHSYEDLGEHTVMVKVIDIFGNDTSTIVRLKVG